MAKNSSFYNTDRIYLTGFMDSCKSTVGRILSGLLHRQFVDLDDVIAREAGMTIPEIFRCRGEEAFREMETGTAARFTTGQWVVALGGGTLVNPETREILISEGTVVYLRARPATLADRLSGQREDRPLLAGDEPLEKRVSSVLEARSRIYSCAQWTLDTDEMTPEQVADWLYRKIRNKADARVH